MELFQVLLLIGLGFCLGRLFKFLDEERKITQDIYQISTTKLAKIMHRGYHVIIVALAIISIFLLVGLIGPYLQ